VSVRRPAVGGADGCPPGWILVVRSAEGAVEGQLCRSAAELFERAGELAALAIDIPIGIPEAGARPADREARALLGPRRNSVFPAPVRAALEATDYRDASERSFRAQGKRLSKQAYHLIPKIREIDAALRADARMAARVHEVHPEVSFTLLNDGVPMPPRSTTKLHSVFLRLVRVPSPDGVKAALNWKAFHQIGATSRPSGLSWRTHILSTSHTPTDAMMRSYAARGAYPSAPSPCTTLTARMPASAR